MKRLSWPLIVFLMVAAASVAQQTPKQPARGTGEDQEPPQLFFLEFDGKRVPLELDKPVGTDPLGGAKAITLRVESYRIFSFDGFHFHYPREYAFKANLESPSVSIWTLTGNECTITVERLKAQNDPEAAREAFSKELMAAYTNSKPSAKDVTMNIRGKSQKGTRVEVRLATTLIRQDIFSFPSGKDAIILILQDTPQENGNASADRARAEKMFCESFRFPGK